MKKKVISFVLYIAVVGVGVFLLIFLTTSTIIGFSVKEKCQNAQQKYEGDCPQALADFLQDEDNSLKDRNSAIWALGQMGDDSALPVLQKYYTGQIPDREPLDETLSQYELKKAIKLLDGGFNLTAFVWR